jgi:hypothetical protein
MRPGWLVRASGLASMGELTAEAREGLQEAAYAFLRAGGSFDARDWETLSAPERAALVAAGDALRHEEAAALTEALVTALVGDPDTRAQAACQQAADAELVEGGA